MFARYDAEQTLKNREVVQFHAARGGRKGHYFVLYCVQSQAKPLAIDVLRLLHDFMDLRRHADHRIPGLCYAIGIR